MMKKCGHNKPCGCVDDVLYQAPPCQTGYPDCPFPEVCSETTSADCVIYTGDTIVDLGIQKGMRVSDIIQKLVNVVLNPGCTYPSSPCASVIGLRSLKITNSMIYLGWNSILGNPNYQVSYKLPSDVNWISNSVTVNNTDVIGNLVPDTNYYVRVATLCAGSNICYSVILEIKTKK